MRENLLCSLWFCFIYLFPYLASMGGSYKSIDYIQDKGLRINSILK